MTPLELLAPAKNLACGIAAIDHGADAVYIGAPHFGARAAAGNSLEDIRTLYFPAYEIVLDELRDYRFYDPDMIHPSTLAVPDPVKNIESSIAQTALRGKGNKE